MRRLWIDDYLNSVVDPRRGQLSVAIASDVRGAREAVRRMTLLWDDERLGRRKLKIVGEWGSGKTVHLLSLARDLLNRAAVDPAEPVPVVVNVSSWNPRERNLRSVGP